MSNDTDISQFLKGGWDLQGQRCFELNDGCSAMRVDYETIFNVHGGNR